MAQNLLESDGSELAGTTQNLPARPKIYRYSPKSTSTAQNPLARHRIRWSRTHRYGRESTGIAQNPMAQNSTARPTTVGKAQNPPTVVFFKYYYDLIIMI